MTVVEWLVLPVISGIVVAILCAEARAWGPKLHLWLIKRATAGLPDEYKSRYQEEFLAELATLPDGPLTRITFTSSLFLRRRSLATALGGYRRSGRRNRAARYEWLRDGETLVVITRPSYRVGTVLPAIVSPPIAAYAAAYYLNHRSDMDGLLGPGVFAVSVLLLGSYVWSIKCFLKWRAMRYAISNLRLTSAYAGWPRRDVHIPLTRIQHVMVSQKPGQRVRRSGDVYLECDNQPFLLITDVPEAARFKDILIDSMKDARLDETI